MAEKVLVAIEISKKQNYIFKSNKLRENIGASLIIKHVTEDLWQEFTKENKKIYSGGGNSYFEFDSNEKAKEFIKQMSFHILKNYEGLEFYGAIESGRFNKDNMDKLKNKLAFKKLKRQNSFRKVSFGIEEICRSTSTPVLNYIDDEKVEGGKRAVSQEAWIKNEFFNKLDKNSDSNLFTNNKFPIDLDEFGEDKNNQIALVSIDGNKMGDMVKKIINENETDSKNLKESLEDFSNFIKSKYKNAFDSIITEFENNKIKNKKGKLLIRPLVLAGDDVTYIVDSKYALESVRIFTESIENANLKEKFTEFNKLTIGAGVVFINKKAPFNKAYDMAEDLCKNAKVVGGGDCSVVDWHILKGEFDEINDIREKINHRLDNNAEKKEEKNLFIRPVKLKSEDDNKPSLAQVLSTVDYINNTDNNVRVGKLRELLGIFDEGKTKTDLFINKYRLNEDIKNINNQLGYSDYDRPYRENTYHLHDILELCNDKYYKSLKAGDK